MAISVRETTVLEIIWFVIAIGIIAIVINLVSIQLDYVGSDCENDYKIPIEI
jgi:hypothetical protein